MVSTETDPAALARQSRQLETLDTLAKRFGQSLSGALSGGTREGRDLSGVLDRVAASFQGALAKGLGSSVSSALDSALRGASESLAESFGSLGFGGAFPFARGGVISRGAAIPFAAGGVVAAPTYFPMARGLGLMGERGAEAIMPLARGPDGRLGVRSGNPGATHVQVTIATPDAESFRRSEAQVSAALARAVARGRRGL